MFAPSQDFYTALSEARNTLAAKSNNTTAFFYECYIINNAFKYCDVGLQIPASLIL